MRGLIPRFIIEEGLTGEGVADDADDDPASNPDDSDSDPGSLSLSLRDPMILAYSGSTGRSKTLKSTSRNDMLALIVDLVFLIIIDIRFTNLLFIFRLFVRSGYFVNFILFHPHSFSNTISECLFFKRGLTDLHIPFT